MSFLTDLQNKPLRTRWFIAIVFTFVIMSAVVYFWYNSLQNVLSGSFKVANQSNITSKNTTQESFLSSLKGLFGDLSIDTSRLKEIKASIPKLSEVFQQFKGSADN